MESAIIGKFPLFESYKKKEKFFTTVGLLFTRQITLAKAAELLEISRDELSKVLRLMGLEYSYLPRKRHQMTFRDFNDCSFQYFSFPGQVILHSTLNFNKDI